MVPSPGFKGREEVAAEEEEAEAGSGWLPSKLRGCFGVWGE